MTELSIEKQLTHQVFRRQLESLDLATARTLLMELHLLYLNQQAMFTKITKQGFLGESK